MVRGCVTITTDHDEETSQDGKENLVFHGVCVCGVYNVTTVWCVLAELLLLLLLL
jgi:hypothetical protein